MRAGRPLSECPSSSISARSRPSWSGRIASAEEAGDLAVDVAPALGDTLPPHLPAVPKLYRVRLVHGRWIPPTTDALPSLRTRARMCHPLHFGFPR